MVLRNETKKEEELKRLRETSFLVKEQREREEKEYRVPKKLIFPLSWTAFFIIMGITQKSIIEGKFVFLDFFWKNYINWFSNFGNFSSGYLARDYNEIFILIFSEWYYFFITGGLLSILWAIIYLIFTIRVRKTKDHFDFS